MSTHWLDIQSFQQSQEILSAINTLSIHRKLTDRGYPDTNRKAAAEQARKTLVAFFEKLDKIVQDIEYGHRKPVLGCRCPVAPSGRELRPGTTRSIPCPTS